MTTITAEDFFRLYEQATNDFDVHRIATLYADSFMFASPQGVQAVKKEDFIKVLPRRKDFMKTAGLLSSRIDSVETSALDSNYILVKAGWNMTFRTNSGSEVSRKILATYVLLSMDSSYQIVFQLDHQDLMAVVQELRAQS